MMSSHGHSHVQSRGKATLPHPDERDLLQIKGNRLMIRLSISIINIIPLSLLSGRREIDARLFKELSKGGSLDRLPGVHMATRHDPNVWKGPHRLTPSCDKREHLGWVVISLWTPLSDDATRDIEVYILLDSAVEGERRTAPVFAFDARKGTDLGVGQDDRRGCLLIRGTSEKEGMRIVL